MSGYELRWCEPVLNSSGKVIIAGGMKHCPIRKEKTVEGLLAEAMQIYRASGAEMVKREARYYNCFVKWFQLISEYKDKNGISDTTSPSEFLDADKLRDLAIYVEYTDVVDFSTAKKKVLPLFWNNFTEETTWQIIDKLGLLEKTDSSEIDNLIEEIFSRFPDKVEEHKSGKKNLVGMFMGEIMRSGKVKANPKELNELIRKKLEK